VKRLGDEIVGVLQTRYFFLLARKRGKKYDGDEIVLPNFFLSSARGKAVHAGHHHVEEDKINRLAFD